MLKFLKNRTFRNIAVHPSSIFLPLVLLVSQPLFGQRDEFVAFDRPEAWAMKYFAAVGLMQGNGPPHDLGKGKWALGFEVANIPHLSEGYRRVGFRGTKVEDLNKAPLLARPLIHYGLTEKFSITGSYVPPVEVFDGLKTHLAGVSVNYDLWKKGPWRTDLRLVGQWTKAEGSFTAPPEVVNNPDPEINPFGAIAPSEDIFTSWTATLEAAVYYRLKTSSPSFLFANISYTYADLDFEVYSLQEGDFLDNRQLLTNGKFQAYGLGYETHISEKVSLRIMGLYAPLSVRRPEDFERENDSLLNLRVILNYRM